MRAAPSGALPVPRHAAAYHAPPKCSTDSCLGADVAVVTRPKGFSVLAAICSDSGALCAVFSRRPRRPAGHARPRAASLRSCRCMWCRQALTGAADPTACLRMEALRWGPRMRSVLLCYRWTEPVLAMCAKSGGASLAEIECWAAEEWLFSAPVGTAEPVGTLGRGLPG